MAKNEIGDWFQSLIWKQLQLDQSRTKPTPMVHQFVDSKAARGFVSAQPSDFLITYELGTVYLEVKASGKHSQLPLSMIRDQQIAHAALIGEGTSDLQLLKPYQFPVLFRTCQHSDVLGRGRGGGGQGWETQTETR